MKCWSLSKDKHGQVLFLNLSASEIFISENFWANQFGGKYFLYLFLFGLKRVWESTAHFSFQRRNISSLKSCTICVTYMNFIIIVISGWIFNWETLYFVLLCTFWSSVLFIIGNFDFDSLRYLKMKKHDDQMRSFENLIWE